MYFTTLYMNAFVYIYIYIYIYIYMNVCIYMYIIYVYCYIHVYMYMLMYTCICAFVYVHVHVYVYIPGLVSCWYGIQFSVSRLTIPLNETTSTSSIFNVFRFFNGSNIPSENSLFICLKFSVSNKNNPLKIFKIFKL